MRKTKTLAAVSIFTVLPAVGYAADAFSATSVPQAVGYTDVRMSVEDTMAVAKQLSVASSSLPSASTADGNSAFIVQFGSYNNADLTQTGTRNVSFIAQNGYYNTAIAKQTGSGHQSMVVQKGVGNTAVVTQR